ncbi:MAG: DUF4258 domain-containing protein [Chloroflexi bacterium]|nr:DUF4258 domain-containing protein [Chloroflexota bacterium]
MTRHGTQEALAEGITVTEIREAIARGTILEDYPEHQRGPCCLIYGKTALGRDLHLVVTTGRTPVILITVYEPGPPRWVGPETRGQR